MKASTALQQEEETKQETSKEKAKRLKKEMGMDSELSLPIRIMECELYDWDVTSRMTLLVIALGQRTNKDAWLPDDLPDEMRETAMGWCYFAQWRIALRVGKSENRIQKVIARLERDGVIRKEEWTDSNNAKHDRYRVVEAMIDDNQRPAQRKNVERPNRYKNKRGANKGSFSSTNQPGMRDVEAVEDDE